MQKFSCVDILKKSKVYLVSIIVIGITIGLSYEISTWENISNPNSLIIQIWIAVVIAIIVTYSTIKNIENQNYTLNLIKGMITEMLSITRTNNISNVDTNSDDSFLNSLKKLRSAICRIVVNIKSWQTESDSKKKQILLGQIISNQSNVRSLLSKLSDYHSSELGEFKEKMKIVEGYSNESLYEDSVPDLSKFEIMERILIEIINDVKSSKTDRQI